MEYHLCSVSSILGLTLAECVQNQIVKYHEAANFGDIEKVEILQKEMITFWR